MEERILKRDNPEDDGKKGGRRTKNIKKAK